jgi:CHAD domain-containing protein
MRYQLKKSESIPANIRRIILGQQKNAIEFLTSPGMDADLAIHETRKCFKRIRAVFRMVRFEVGDGIFRKENEIFRDAGRLLSGVRDSAVLLQTLTNLKQTFNEGISGEIYESLKSRFETMHKDTFDRIVNEEKGIDKAATITRAARFRVAELPLERDGFEAISKGVKKVYSSGYKAFIKSQYEPTAEMFHEWRKMVKNLWYHVTLLKPINPPELRKLSLLLDKLSDLLGIDHDLHQLEVTLRKLPEVVENIELYEKLFNAIQIQSFITRAEAWKLGNKVYSVVPVEFIKTLEVSYNRWKSE